MVIDSFKREFSSGIPGWHRTRATNRSVSNG